jgi:hypothetical protein
LLLLLGASSGDNVREERLRLGIVIRNVLKTESGAGYPINVLAPNIEPVQMTLLEQSLRQLGFPEFIRLLAARPSITRDFSTISVQLDAEVTALAIPLSEKLVFVSNGQALDPFEQMRLVGDKFATQVREALQSQQLELAVDGIGKVQLTSKSIQLRASQGTATVTGLVSIPTPQWALDPAIFDNPSIDIEASLDVDLKALRIEPHLVDATLPPPIAKAFGNAVSAKLDAVEFGQSACIQVISFQIKQRPTGELALVAAMSKRGDANRKDVELPLSSSLETALPRFAADVGYTADALATCVQQRVLEQAGLRIEEWIKELEGKSIDLLSINFRFHNVKWEGDTRGRFRADLVSSDPAGLAIEGVSVDGGWRPEQPLNISRLSFTGIALPAKLFDAAIRKAAPQLANIITIRGARIIGNEIEVDLTTSLPAIDNVTLDGLRLSLSSAASALRQALHNSLLDAIDAQSGRLSRALADLGAIREGSIHLAREGGRHLSDLEVPRLVVHLEVEAIQGVRFPLRVTLPQLKVEPEGNFLDLVKGALGPVVGMVAGELGNLTIGDEGAGIGDLAPLIDDVHRRYGAIFSAHLKLADTIGFEAKGISLDQHGLKLPDTIAVEIPGYYPIPPYLQVNHVTGMVSPNPPGRFGVSLDLTLLGDEPGITLDLHGSVEGDGPNRVITANGRLSVLRIPLFEAEGKADFKRSRMDLISRSVEPLSRLLNVSSLATIDAQEQIVSAAANASLLSLKTDGTFRLTIKNQQATIDGKAGWTDLGDAAIGIVAAPDLRRPHAHGSLHLRPFGIDSDFSIDAGSADLKFSALGAHVRIIAPSALRIDAAVVERAIRALLDFKFSWEALKNREITINLLDPGGNPTDQPSGGGEPLRGPDDAGKPAAPQQPDPRDPNAMPPVVPAPTIVTGGGGDANWKDNGLVDDTCANKSKFVGVWRNVPAGADPNTYNRKRIEDVNLHWLADQKLPNDNYYEADLVGIYPKVTGVTTRVASQAVRTALRSSTIISCLDIDQLPFQQFKYQPDWLPWASTTVAITTPTQGAPQLQALVFRLDAGPVDIVLPAGADQVIFGTDLTTAIRERYPITDLGSDLLKEIVTSQLGVNKEWKINAVTPLSGIDLIPEWEPRPAYILDRTRYDNVRELALRRWMLPDGEWTNSPPPPSFIFDILSSSPNGFIANLIGAATHLDDDLEFITSWNSPCITIKANASPEIQYIVAHEGDNTGVVRLSNATPESLADQDMYQFLARLCSSLATLGRDATMVLAKDPVLGGPVAASRNTYGGAKRWWLAWSESQDNTKIKPHCANDDQLHGALTSAAGFVRDKSVLDWSSPDNVNRMLNSLAGVPGEWQRYFISNPQGKFPIERGCD